MYIQSIVIKKKGKECVLDTEKNGPCRSPIIMNEKNQARITVSAK